MKIGIIGYGIVGKAVDKTLSKKYEIVRFDKFKTLDEFDDLTRCDFVFITVPTPFDYLNNEVDLSSVTESLDRLDKVNYKGIVIIKSTIPPGTCMSYLDSYSFSITFNPEFLRESTTPNEDFENQSTVVIGTPSNSIFNEVKEMFSHVLLPQANYFHTSLDEAEMIKTAQNMMLASRVSLANIIFDACKLQNIEYNRVKEIAFDEFEILGPQMTLVPGPDGKRGFGGKCLPKDTLAFNSKFKSRVLEEIIRYNETLRDDLSKVLKNFEG